MTVAPIKPFGAASEFAWFAKMEAGVISRQLSTVRASGAIVKSNGAPPRAGRSLRFAPAIVSQRPNSRLLKEQEETEGTERLRLCCLRFLLFKDSWREEVRPATAAMERWGKAKAVEAGRIIAYFASAVYFALRNTIGPRF